MKYMQYYQRNKWCGYEDRYVKYEQIKRGEESACLSEMERVFAFVEERRREIIGWASALEDEVMCRLRRKTGRGHRKELRLFEKKLGVLKENVVNLSRFVKVNVVGFRIALRKSGLYRKYKKRLAEYRREMTDMDKVLYAVSQLVLRYRNSGKDGGKRPSDSTFIRRTSKYWVHPENVNDLKACILRHLPIYVFNPDDRNYESWSDQYDSSITSIYLDNASLDIYNTRLYKLQGSEAIRVRWYGLAEPTIVFIERKKHEDGWTGYQSKKLRFKMPVDRVTAYLRGEDVWKWVAKLNDDKQGTYALYKEIQDSVVQRQLRPSLRTFYRRMAFQLPESNEVRLSLDTDLVMIKEYMSENEHEIVHWRREGIHWPFDNLRNDEIVRFPYAILEVKTQKDQKTWIDEYAHLIEHVHKFSKFMHGTAVLYNTEVIPYWLPQMGVGIRKEIYKTPPSKRYDFTDGKLVTIKRDTHVSTDRVQGGGSTTVLNMPDGAMRSPASSYTRKHAHQHSRSPKKDDDESTKSVLIPIDNKRIAIPVRVEPKVFFANERTFLSWLHFSIFIGGLGSAMVGLGDFRAIISGTVFIVVSTVFALYALYLYMWRAQKIRARNPGPYDDLIGPGILVFVFISAMGLSLLFKMPLH